MARAAAPLTRDRARARTDQPGGAILFAGSLTRVTSIFRTTGVGAPSTSQVPSIARPTRNRPLAASHASTEPVVRPAVAAAAAPESEGERIVDPPFPRSGPPR